MGAWGKLKGLLASPEPLHAHFDDPFIQLDKASASEQLRLRERGEEQGKLDLPPPSMEAFDNVESEIIARVSEHHSRAQIDANNSVRTYDGRLAGLALLSNLSSIKAQAGRASGDFKVQVGNALNSLSNSRDAISSSYEELREFRTSNRINRPAHPAPPQVSTYGAILLSWFFETLMNAFLLRQNDAMGYLGGVVAAATVGAINILGSAAVGRQVWPQTNHISPRRKVLGWLGVLLWFVVMIAWNLLAAYFRDAKSAGVDHPEQQALEMLIGFQGLQSIYSWGLLFAGIIFAFSAAIAAYKMDDPYPGYGPVTRRHHQRCEDYVVEVTNATDELIAIRDDAIDEATSFRQGIDRQLSERTQIEGARAAYLRRFDEFSTQLELVANALLQDYRMANLAVRSQPAPKHFSGSWRLPRTEFQPPPHLDISASDVKAAEVALDRAIAEIVEHFDTTIRQFESLDELKRRLSDG